MKYTPHDYQKYAADFIIRNEISAVFLEMGLGKTSITLTALNELLFERFEVSKILIIAPLRVARNTWTNEIEKWDHLKDLKCSVAVGKESERKAALETKADIYVINRENVPWLIENCTFDFDMVVIDELSSFKNHQAKRFRALMKVRPKVKRIVGLTGTPSSSGLIDLYAEFKILDMGERLGRFIGNFRNTYFTPDKRNGAVIYSYKPLPFAEDEIYKRISDITVSMKAIDHLKMPELISTEYTVTLSERKKYEKFRQELVLPEDEITAANAAALSNKLVQMANGAVYDDNENIVKIHDNKLDALEDIIESANGKPILVAYWYKHDLTRISERLNKIGIEYRQINDDESIRKWNNGEIPVALIHPASAGHGLNLQDGGSNIVWFSLTWSLELYQQTNARLYRQGQKDTVVIQHIVCKGTIDEDILKALNRKESGQNALIEAVKWRVSKNV